MKTRITELFDIEHPIIQGGMQWVGLAELAIHFAGEVLAPGGFFVAKVFQGGADAELLAQLKRDFTTVKHVKPAASRQDSSERYVMATGFRGANDMQRD